MNLFIDSRVEHQSHLHLFKWFPLQRLAQVLATLSYGQFLMRLSWDHLLVLELFTYLIDGVTKTEISLLVAHCPDAFNSQDWLRLPREKRNPLWVSGVGGRDTSGCPLRSTGGELYWLGCWLHNSSLTCCTTASSPHFFHFEWLPPGCEKAYVMP